VNGKRERMPAVAVPPRYRDLPMSLTGTRRRRGSRRQSRRRIRLPSSDPPLLFFIRTGAADSRHRTQLQKIEVEDR
jgi:hypothetical protein